MFSLDQGQADKGPGPGHHPGGHGDGLGVVGVHEELGVMDEDDEGEAGVEEEMDEAVALRIGLVKSETHARPREGEVPPPVRRLVHEGGLGVGGLLAGAGLL